MYVKSDKRLIVDHDLVTVNVKLVFGDSEVDLYPEINFTHGYLHESEIDIVDFVKNCLPIIVDKYVTNKINLSNEDVLSVKKIIQIPDICLGSYLLITVVNVLMLNYFWNMSEEEKIEAAILLKTRGNYKAHLSEWSDAFKNFHRASKYLKSSICVTENSHKLHKVAKDVLVACMNNVALSCLKLSSGYNLCVKYCDFVLSLEPNNTKALYRKAKALSKREEWCKALQCVDRCLELEKSDEKALREFSQLRNLCQSNFKMQQQQERSLCRDILSKMETMALKNGDCGDDRSVISYDIDPWDNTMADEWLSIQQELEAFGEQMPPRCVPPNGICDKIEEEEDY